MTIKPTPQHILNLLAQRTATLPEIAQHAGITRDHASTAVTRLVRAGSIKRIPGDPNRYMLMPRREAAAVKYEPLQLHDMPPLRPGALDYLKHPSRRGNRLFYADGRVEVME